MRLNGKSLMMAGTLSLATVATFTGCATGDRSTGQYIDDRATASKVKSQLKADPIFKFEDVTISTYRGVVQLNGWVNDQEQKQIAEKIARKTPGVLDVVNNLTLKPDFQLIHRDQRAVGGSSSGTNQMRGASSQDTQYQYQPRSQEQLQRERELQREQQQREQQQQDQP